MVILKLLPLLIPSCHWGINTANGHKVVLCHLDCVIHLQTLSIHWNSSRLLLPLHYIHFIASIHI